MEQEHAQAGRKNHYRLSPAQRWSERRNVHECEALEREGSDDERPADRSISHRLRGLNLRNPRPFLPKTTNSARRHEMRIRLSLVLIYVFVTVSFAADASAMQLTRDIKVISSAGARSLVDACAAWAEKNKLIEIGRAHV